MKISLLGLPCLTVLVFEDMSAILIRRLAYNVYCKVVNAVIIAPNTGAIWCNSLIVLLRLKYSLESYAISNLTSIEARVILDNIGTRLSLFSEL